MKVIPEMRRVHQISYLKYGYRCQERKEGEVDRGWWRLSMYKSINQIRYLYFLPPLIERSQHLFEQTGHLPLRPIQHH
jgi:hypothetical protein